MDINAYQKLYAEVLNFEEKEALPELYKSRALLQISPDESDFSTRTTMTFSQKNLDIHALYSQSYIYMTCSVQITSNLVAKDLSTITTGAYSSEEDHFAMTSCPSSAGVFQGYQYQINDIDVDSVNNNLQSQLYVLNSGIFAEDNKLELFTGLAKPENGPMWYQRKKTDKSIELYIPLKYVVPFLKNESISWGLKHSIVLQRATLAQQFFRHNPSFAALLNSGDGVTSFEITKARWMVPYVRLQSDKLLSLTNKLYNSTISYYYLACDQYFSSPLDNASALTNETIRITSKNVNSRPKWLLVSAVDASAPTVVNNTSVPLGFTNATTDAGNQNNFVPKSLRVRLNGLYIDQGDILEFTNKDIAVATDDPNVGHKGMFRAYEFYCQYYNKFDSKEVAPKTFEDWLREQIYVFDLTNIDSESIFSNSSNTIIIELEVSTYKGSATASSKIKMCMQVLYDRKLAINHSANTSVLQMS